MTYKESLIGRFIQQHHCSQHMLKPIIFLTQEQPLL